MQSYAPSLSDAAFPVLWAVIALGWFSLDLRTEMHK